MARNTNDHTVLDEKQPFKHFQETVKTLLKVPKDEVDKAIHSHQEERKLRRGEKTN